MAMQTNVTQKLLSEIDLLISRFNTVFNKHINLIYDPHKQVFNQLKQNFLDFHEKTPLNTATVVDLKGLYNFHQQNLKIIETIYTDLSQPEFAEQLFTELNTLRLEYLENFNNELREPYDKNYFQLWKNGNANERFFSRVEKSIYNTKWVWNFTENFFRKLIKKELSSFIKPIRCINVPRIINEEVFPVYLQFVQENIAELRQSLVEKNLMWFTFEGRFIKHKYTLNEELNIEKLEILEYTNHQNKLKTFFAIHASGFLSIIQKEGTFLALQFSSNGAYEKSINKSRIILEEEAAIWQNTFFVIFEDWRFREHLYSYIIGVKESKLITENLIQRKIDTILIAQVDNLIAYTNNLLDGLPNPEEANKDAIRTFLKTKLYKLKKDVLEDDKTEETSNNAVIEIPNLLRKFELDITCLLAKMPVKVALVKNPDFMKGLKKSEMNYFSPKEFVEFEFLPSFFSYSTSIQSQLGVSLKHILNQYKDYDQVIDFYLDTSIALTDKDEVSEKQIIQVFEEGLQRLQKININVKELLLKIKDENLSDITQNSDSLIVKLEQLDDSDNIFSIQVRMLRSKTSSAVRKASKRLLSEIKTYYAIFLEFYRAYNNKFNEAYVQVKLRLKITNPASTVTSEISNYLTEIERRVTELPVVYQHLFEISPVKESNLFLSRDVELEKLIQAYNDFLKGYNAATILIGENGSGKSSLLNYYFKSIKSKFQIITFHITDFYISDDDFYRLMNEIFHQKTIASMSDLHAHIDTFHEPRIVILDGLERLFNRKLEGFDCMQKFLSLILSSNHKILWTCSVSKIAGNYLNKTVNLFEYFDHKIEINTLEKEQIKNIVLKRNKLSGYQIIYLDKDLKNEEKSTKIDVLKQEQLENAFFTALNKFADSNISLSLYFWLQSIESIENEIIYIHNFLLPDFSFLENISSIKAYALLNIVLHGKLTTEYFHSIANISFEESFRTLSILKEDSILLFHNGYYTLNGFLYKHVIRILNNRNLIH